MGEEGFEQFGEIDSVTRTYLNEMLYCLMEYLNMERHDAYQLIVTNEYLKDVISTEPIFLQEETPFYWAMLLARKTFWWRDEQLKQKNEDYQARLRRPPT